MVLSTVLCVILTASNSSFPWETGQSLRLPQLCLPLQWLHQPLASPPLQARSPLQPPQRQALELLKSLAVLAQPRACGTASPAHLTNDVRAVPGLLLCNLPPALPAPPGSLLPSTSPPSGRPSVPSDFPTPMSVVTSTCPRSMFHRRSISTVFPFF